MQSKETLRQYYRDLRQNLVKTAQDEEFMVKNLFDLADANFINPVISGYDAIHHELDPNFLKKLIIKRGWCYCLPVIHKGTKVLRFEDTQDKHEITPDILLVPLLAFDNQGDRLGYGGGYYDTTLKSYADSNHPFITIGVAYDEQYCQDCLPREDHDVRLDYVLTTKRVFQFK